jgi:hypothetical protein
MPFNPLASPTAAAAAANDASEAAGQQQQQQLPDFLHASKEPAGAYEYSSRESLPSDEMWGLLLLFSCP